MRTFSTYGRRSVFGLAFALTFVISSGILLMLYHFNTTIKYPTHDWQSSTPEEQGFDSAKLADGLAAIQKNGTHIHSLMIVRHGSVIVNANFYPYDGSLYHDTASVTKSVMTTLIGIAADQGQLDLNQPIVSFFPEQAIANLDTRKEQITVRHLVSMSSGLDCTAEGGERTLEEMKSSPDMVQFVLDRKVIYEPGTHFEYCSPGMHLLSAILQQATGMTALEYAKIHLFEPLGIHDIYWPADSQGYTHGWGDLALYPQDMARLGYLILQEGRWEGKQIVPRKWVREATRKQMETGESEDYGYGWWVSRPDAEFEYYLASGRGGQRIQVIPSLDLVLVTTGGGYEFSEIEEYLKAAIGDLEKPLHPNPAGYEHLKTVVSGLVLPPPAHSVLPLPGIAESITGQTFQLETNPTEARSIQLNFGTSAEATLLMDVVNETEPRLIRVGLDGVYRITEGRKLAMARGEWIDDETFMIDYAEGLGLDAYTLKMHFNGDRVLIEVNDLSHGVNLNISGQTGK